MLEQAGFAAIATTSAGIAFSRGAADGTMDRSEMLDCIARIVSAVACPVSADLESGYGTTADDVAATVAAAVKLGVVGGNLEDVTRPGELLPVEAACERLEAARTAAPAGSFVLNARTDAYMIRHPDPFAETVGRPSATWLPEPTAASFPVSPGSPDCADTRQADCGGGGRGQPPGPTVLFEVDLSP